MQRLACTAGPIHSLSSTCHTHPPPPRGLTLSDGSEAEECEPTESPFAQDDQLNRKIVLWHGNILSLKVVRLFPRMSEWRDIFCCKCHAGCHAPICFEFSNCACLHNFIFSSRNCFLCFLIHIVVCGVCVVWYTLPPRWSDRPFPLPPPPPPRRRSSRATTSG